MTTEPTGKDFFSRKSKSDFFETPYSMTEQLLENEKFNYKKRYVEPACGKKAICKILDKYIENCIRYDLIYGYNFFNEVSKYDYLITNPPFSLWDEFINKSKTVALKKFAFLGRLEFLTGIARHNNKLYQDPVYPLTKIHLFTRKVNLTFTEEYPRLRYDGKYPAGMYHYAWFIFENKGKLILKNPPQPQIRWVDNNKYILRKEDL